MRVSVNELKANTEKKIEKVLQLRHAMGDSVNKFKTLLNERDYKKKNETRMLCKIAAQTNWHELMG